MKKEISLKMWLSVFFGGIWQFVCNIFSWKKKTPFWRVIWVVITVCVLAVTSMLGYAFYDDYFRREYRYSEYYDRTDLGNDFYYYHKGKGKGYITEKSTGKKIHKGLDWIARSVDGDSLVVFAKDGKRGFISRRSGKIIIPAKYDAAWCFNDGVAGVCLGDSVFFIDHNDIPIHPRKFARVPDRNYTYYGDYFAFDYNGKFGLIDKCGNIAAPAIYEDIMPMANNMWNVKAGGKFGVVNAEGALIVPCEYRGISIYPEGGIVVMADDYSKKKMDYNGVVTDDFVYDCTYTLDYYSDEMDKDGNRIQRPAHLFAYSSNGHYGLIDKKGNPVTPPVYSSISAYTADLFECQIDNMGEYVILNEKGEKVNLNSTAGKLSSHPDVVLMRNN
ncbi:MAG: WG repeat-containing protein [Muribaculaceae bacterium]|nr:WG repeat-containing protein [Muribaculaceae bacterium]